MIKNKKLLGGLVVFSAVIMFSFYTLKAAGAAEPGSQGDPILTLSYFNQETVKLKSELAQKISSLETELASVKKELSDAKTQIANLKTGSSNQGSTTPPQTTTPPASGITPPSTLGYGYVTASSLNVREGAGTNYKKVGSLLLNNKVTLLSKTGEWYKIKYGNITGWVLGAYIKK
jgi:hypothetical protein